MRLLVGLIMLCLMSSTAVAQGEERDPSEMIEFQCEGLDLDRMLKLLSDELGIRILYDEKLLKRKVWLLSPVKVQRKDLLALFASILEMQNFTMVKSGPADAEVWKVVPFTAPIANPSNKGKIMVVSQEDLDRLPDSEELATLVINLRHADARGAFIAAQGMASDPRMVRMIESANTICLTDLAHNLRWIGKAIQAMDVPPPVEGEPSVAVETCLFDVSSASLGSLGIRTSATKEGKPIDQVDAGALWAALFAAGGTKDVRVLHRWEGRILEGVPMRTAVRTDSLDIRLAVVAGLPRRPKPQPPTEEGVTPATRPPGPVEGEVSLNVGLDVTSTGEGGKVQSEDQTTLAGKEGAWFVWAIQSAAQDGVVRLFFARANR